MEAHSRESNKTVHKMDGMVPMLSSLQILMDRKSIRTFPQDFEALYTLMF